MDIVQLSLPLDGKHCSKCGEWKPLDAFVPSSRYRSGRISRCRECSNKMRSAYYYAVEKDSPAFQERAKLQREAWYANNKEHHYENTKRWQAANKEKFKETQRKSTKRHRQEKTAYARKHRAENPDQYRTYVENRRARRIAAEGSYTPSEWTQLCERYDNRCLACGTDGPLTADHVIPLSKGGRNDIGNIQPLCGPCNSSKGTRTIDYRP